MVPMVCPNCPFFVALLNPVILTLNLAFLIQSIQFGTYVKFLDRFGQHTRHVTSFDGNLQCELGD